MTAAPTPSETATAPEVQARRRPVVGQSETDGDTDTAAGETVSPGKTTFPARPSDNRTASQRPASQHNAPLRSDDLEAAVRDAIEKRAITGVTVSLTQGTVILGGRVASERQRRTVERAVRNVNGVKQVLNQIDVNYD